MCKVISFAKSNVLILSQDYMEDKLIVDLFLERSEAAIAETEKKYNRYLTKIAYNVLYDLEDCKECVNDTYFKAWNSIPPHIPNVLSVYLGKITRENAIDIFRKKSSKKRGGTCCDVALSELEECIGQESGPWQEIEERFLADTINKFLRLLPEKHRNIFICRYYYLDSVKDIAACSGDSESKVKSILYRTRVRLKEYLESEGFVI